MAIRDFCIKPLYVCLLFAGETGCIHVCMCVCVRVCVCVSVCVCVVGGWGGSSNSIIPSYNFRDKRDGCRLWLALKKERHAAAKAMIVQARHCDLQAT